MCGDFRLVSTYWQLESGVAALPMSMVTILTKDLFGSESL